MISIEELKQFKELIKSFKPDFGDFERSILIPQVSGRIDYIYEIFESFVVLTNDQPTAVLIDAAVRDLIDPRVINTAAPEPQVGEAYLRMIRELIQTQYLDPIDDLRGRYAITDLLNWERERFFSYLNEVKILLDGIVSVKEKMFTMAFRPMVNIRNTRTGQVLYGPPETLSIILVPFETRMAELINVAATTIESIRIWSDKVKEQELKHVQMIADLAQIKVAQEQTNATRWNMAVQVAVVVLAVVLVILSQPINTYIEKWLAEGAFQKASQNHDKCRSDYDSFNSTVKLKEDQLSRDLQECRNASSKPTKKGN